MPCETAKKGRSFYERENFQKARKKYSQKSN